MPPPMPITLHGVHFPHPHIFFKILIIPEQGLVYFSCSLRNAKDTFFSLSVSHSLCFFLFLFSTFTNRSQDTRLFVWKQFVKKKKKSTFCGRCLVQCTVKTKLYFILPSQPPLSSSPLAKQVFLSYTSQHGRPVHTAHTPYSMVAL